DAQLVLEHAREPIRCHVVADDLHRHLFGADDAVRAAVVVANTVRDVREHLREAARRRLHAGTRRRQNQNRNENRNQNQNPEPRTPNAEPVQACTHVSDPRIAKIAGRFKAPASSARATNAEAFATAKLTPLTLRSRGTPGMSRGYGDEQSTVRPSIDTSA